MPNRFPPLVGLYAPAPQSGKSTVASILESEGYITLPFASTIKTLVCILLSELGIPYAQARDLTYHNKDELIPSLRATPRHLLRTLGTEWGRDCVHPELWLKCWQSSYLNYRGSGLRVVVDDVRFANEAALIRELGGELWRIDRPLPPERVDTAHRSEGGLTTYPHFRHCIVNDSTLDALRHSVLAALEAPAVAV